MVESEGYRMEGLGNRRRLVEIGSALLILDVAWGWVSEWI
jgi:hypothetical protein